jgi:hypothetical protein
MMQSRPDHAKLKLDHKIAKPRAVERHQLAADWSDEHARLKGSKVNANCMNAAMAQLAAGKGQEWNPFENSDRSG